VGITGIRRIFDPGTSLMLCRGTEHLTAKFLLTQINIMILSLRISILDSPQNPRKAQELVV
jgi:hypothetical protein